MKKNYFLLGLAFCGSFLTAQAQRGAGGGTTGAGAPGGAGRGATAGPTTAAPGGTTRGGAAPASSGSGTVASNPLQISKSRILLLDSAITTKHNVTIKGKDIPYTASAGSMPVWDEDGRAIAGVFYTYYERTDISDEERATRPFVVSFNGGPGTASLWMQLGYTGPRMLNIDPEGYPIQPYGLKDNPNSILDVADIVYVDPINTGYSRVANSEVNKSQFFGVNEDIKYLATWISTFVSRKNRWASPKFLIGESYGTTRVSGLALELQDAHWMYLNGVVLVSPTDLGIERSGPLGAALYTPYEAATAWYHNALAPEYQKRPLEKYLDEVEKFTINELVPALTKGGMLPAAERKTIANRLSKYIGIKEQVVLDNNLTIGTNFFWKELLRDKGFTVGRLDSRYRGMDRDNAGTRPDYNQEQQSWSHAFTPAIHIHLKDELKYKTDLEYQVYASVYPWNSTVNRTGQNLRLAMAENPFLHLLVQSGYYDGACDYFNAKYSMWQMDPGGRLKDRMKWEGYESGHMMYLRKPDATEANENLRKFFKASVPKSGTPAKY
ncbi:S10 family peptidase [Mucilaginibacter myungsuensis]|uniref:Carboxypeptidase n=1 Tax=Mucilaginibacter myungsuensis TaxID=649104 RepID=A0A929PZD0_9SPHI|nr:carboxypeptidase [Mucilaginibacter myungsuensis]MBE9664370.1 carboxypeptidase [Mucilaginibacter myungsuensis]MDN3597080.1 carboxypeptidase [Mucilaginibacter myungsuensis]